MFIYQIGKQIVRGYSSISSNISFSDTSYLSDANNKLYFNSELPKIEAMKITVSGNLYIFNNTTPYKQINELASLAGVPYVDIIGYMPSEYRFGYGEIDFNNMEVENARWFHTYGQIVSIDRQISDEEDFNEIMPLNLEIVINPVWTPLNEWLWFAEYDLTNINTSIPSTLEKVVLPRTVVDFNYAPHFRFYKRGSYKEPHTELYTNTSNMWNNWLEDDTMFTYISQTIDNTSNAISYTATTDDNYPQYIIYKFEGDDSWEISGYPTVTIEVQSEIQPMTIRSFTTTFELSLRTGQFLIIPCDSPHFICNEAGTITKNAFNGENATLQMSYNTPYPAMLMGRTNYIIVKSTKDTACEILIYNRTL